jgi:hypothetical protein
METPTLADVIRAALDAQLAETRVALPGRVTKYDATRETVDVQPQVRRVLETEGGDLAQENLPIIQDVPIAWPSGKGGTCFMTWPLAADDPVLLVFCDVDPSMWRETGQPGTPGDLRTHRLGNAVAYPGFRPNGALLGSTKVHATKVVIGSGVFLGGSGAGEAMVLGTAFKTAYDAHTHPTPMGPSGPPSSSVALSVKHKLDS